MEEITAPAATGSVGSTAKRAAEELLKWDSMEARFLARAETQGEKGIVKSKPQEDLMEFFAAHVRACSPCALSNLLASQGRTPTDAWNWEDLKEKYLCVRL